MENQMDKATPRKIEPLVKSALKKWSKQCKNKKVIKLAEKVGLFWIDEDGFLHMGKRGKLNE